MYRNYAVDTPTFPYIVYRVRSSSDTYPTNDYMVDVMIFEKNDKTVSIRTAETLGDNIDTTLNNRVIPMTSYYAHFLRDIRQYENDPSLAGAQLIHLQYAVRLYTK